MRSKYEIFTKIKAFIVEYYDNIYVVLGDIFFIMLLATLKDGYVKDGNVFKSAVWGMMILICDNKSEIIKLKRQVNKIKK